MITIHKQPQALMPVYNPIIIAVSSDLQNNPSFHYVAEIYQGSNLLTKMKVPVSPDGYGVFDISRHLENRISNDFTPNNYNAFSNAKNSYIRYSVRIYEEFRYTFEFVDNYYVGGAVAFVADKSKADGGEKPEFVVGDEIFVDQQPGYTNYSYQGIAKVTAIITVTHPDYNGGQPSWAVQIDKPFDSSSSPDSGNIKLSNNRLLVKQISGVFSGAVYNGVFSFEDFMGYDYVDYQPKTTGSYSKFFTTVPDRYKVTLDSMMYINMDRSNINNRRYVAIKTNNGIYRFENSSTNTNLINQMSIGPFKLINGTGGVILGTSSLPMITDDTKEYSFWTENSAAQRDSEIKTFEIDRSCSKYEKIQLIFMDKQGSFIPFTFDRVNRNNKEISRTTYGKKYGQYSPATSNWSYNDFDRGTRTVDINVTEKFICHSNWVDQKTSDFLMELFESPEVYWLKNWGEPTRAINITNSGVEKKQTINDQLINYTIEFEFSTKDMTQRG